MRQKVQEFYEGKKTHRFNPTSNSNSRSLKDYLSLRLRLGIKFRQSRTPLTYLSSSLQGPDACQHPAVCERDPTLSDGRSRPPIGGFPNLSQRSVLSSFEISPLFFPWITSDHPFTEPTWVMIPSNRPGHSLARSSEDSKARRSICAQVVKQYCCLIRGILASDVSGVYLLFSLRSAAYISVVAVIFHPN